LNFEFYFGSLAPPYPVPLHLLHALGPMKLLQIVQQPVGVGRDLKEPLRHGPFFHGVVAAPAAPLLDLLVGQSGLAGRAPVDRRGVPVGQPLFIEQQKDPLGPFIIFRQAGIYLPGPIVTASGQLEGPLVIGGVLRHHLPGVAPLLDGLVLGRLAEGVPAHGMQHIESGHALVAAEGIHRHVVLEVPHMEARPRGVGEHLQAIGLGPVRIVRGLKSLLLFPGLLPPSLDLSKIVFSGHI